MHTLNTGLKSPATGRLTQRQVWDRVVLQAKLQGVVGIHYDECQHIFSSGADARAKTLDSFKSLLKQSEWPLMLILSGVDTLAHHVISEVTTGLPLKARVLFGNFNIANAGPTGAARAVSCLCRQSQMRFRGACLGKPTRRSTCFDSSLL